MIARMTDGPSVSRDGFPADAPPSFHLLAKPSGSTCDIDCTYPYRPGLCDSGKKIRFYATARG